MKVTIKNFKGIESFNRELPALTAIIGRNGSGKTSIKDAIKSAFTSKLDADQIRIGTASAEVTIAPNEEWSFGVRRKTGDQKIEARLDGKTCTQKKLKQVFADNGYNPDYFVGQIGLDYLATADKASLGKLLLGVMKIKFDTKKLLTEADMKLSSPEAEDMFLSMFQGAETAGTEELEAAYNNAYAQRRQEKQLLDRMNRALPDEVDETGLPDDRETLEKELEGLHREEIEFEKEHAVWTDAAIKAETAEKKQLGILDQLEALGQVEPPKKESEEYTKRYNKFKKEIAQCSDYISKKKGEIEALRATEKNLAGISCPHGGKCEIIAKNEDQIAAAEQEIAKYEVQRKKRQDWVQQFEEAKADQEKQQKLYEKMLALKEQAATLELAAQPGKEPVPEKDFKALSKAVQEKISRFDARKKRQANAEKVRRAEERVALLEEVVNVLNPKSGIASRLVAKKLTPYMKACNKKAGTIKPGFKMEFVQGDDGFGINCAPDGENFIPMHLLSSGEFMTAAIALCYIMNKASGARLLVIDNIDQLDAPSLDGLCRLMAQDQKLGEKKNFDTVILMGVPHEKEAEIDGETKKVSVSEEIMVSNGFSVIKL